MRHRHEHGGTSAAACSDAAAHSVPVAQHAAQQTVQPAGAAPQVVAPPVVAPQLAAALQQAQSQLPGKADAAGWSFLSKLSPLLNSGFTLLVVLGIALTNARDRIFALFYQPFGSGNRDDGGWDLLTAVDTFGFLSFFGVTLAGVLLVCFASWIEWRFARYRITTEAVQLRKGILFKRHQVAPLLKIQSVDLERKLLAKLFGLAAVTITTAGGTLKLEYLSHRDAQRVREQLLRLVQISHLGAATNSADSDLPLSADTAQAGVDPRPGVTQQEAETAAVAVYLAADSAVGAGGGATVAGTVPQGNRIAAGAAVPAVTPSLTERIVAVTQDAEAVTSLVRLTLPRIFASLLLSGGSVLLLLALLCALAAAPLLLLLRVDPAVLLETFTAAGLGLLPLLFMVGGAVLKTLNESFNFKIGQSDSGVLISAGLTTTKTVTVPQRRITAIEVAQPLLWRIPGWYSVKFTSAGGNEMEQAAGKSNFTALPVGTLEETLQVVALLRQTQVPPQVAQALGQRRTPLPYRAARRAAWLFLVLHPGQESGGVLRDQFGAMFASRGGLLTRRTCLIALDRAQAVVLSAGLRSTVLGLSRVDTVKRGIVGRSTVRGLPRQAAQQLFAEINQELVVKQSQQPEAASQHDTAAAIAAVIQEATTVEAATGQQITVKAAADD